MTLPKLSFSVREAEQQLGISHATLYKEIGAGRLTTYTIGKRRMVSASALLAYIESRERETASPRVA